MEGEDKMLAPLGGKRLIAHAVAAFEECEAVDAIVLVVNENNREAIAKLCAEMGWRKTAPLVIGGARRQDSVRNGLNALPPRYEWVVVHDGARPFVTPEIIERGLVAAEETGAAMAVVPAFDATVTPDGRLAAIQQSGESPLAQTPQVFCRAILEFIHNKVNDDVVDEAEMAQRLGLKIVVFEGKRSNIKVRNPYDLMIVRNSLLEDRLREAIDEITIRDGFLDRHEDRIQAKIEADFAGSFRIVGVAFEQIASGLQGIGTLNDLDHPKLSLAWFKLVTLACSSLRTSMLVLRYGYYFQSIGLVRTAMEANLIARDRDFQAHQNPLRVLEEEIGSGDFTINNILNRLPESESQTQKKRYGDLSEWGSHLRRRSLELIQHGSGMNIAGHCEKDVLLSALKVILYELLKLLEIMGKLSELVEFNWAISAHPVIIDVGVLLEDITDLLDKEQSESSFSSQK